MRQQVRDLVADGERPALRGWEEAAHVRQRRNEWEHCCLQDFQKIDDGPKELVAPAKRLKNSMCW